MREPRIGDYLSVSLLWLPFNLLWSALLVQGMQVRIEHFAPPEGQDRLLFQFSAVGAVVATLAQLLVGPWSDNCASRWGRRRPFIFVGIVFNTFALWGFVAARNFLGFLLAAAASQLFTNIAAGPFQALLPDKIPPKHHGRASAFMGLFTLIGNASGLALSGFLLRVPKVVSEDEKRAVEAHGLAVLIFIASALLLATMLFTAWAAKEEPLPAQRALPLKAAFKETYNLQLRRYPDFTWLLISRFVINLGFYTAIQHLRWYVRDSLHHQDIAQQTMWISLSALIGSVLVIHLAGELADRFSKRLLIFISCTITAVAGLLFCVSHSLTAVKLVAFLFGIGWGCFGAVDWAFACNLLPEGKAAKYMAIFHFAFTIPQVLGPAGGALVAQWGTQAWNADVGRRLVYGLCVICFVVGTVLIRNVRERRVDTLSGSG